MGYSGSTEVDMDKDKQIDEEVRDPDEEDEEEDPYAESNRMDIEWARDYLRQDDYVYRDEDEDE